MRKKREVQNNNPPTGSTPPFCPTTTLSLPMHTLRCIGNAAPRSRDPLHCGWVGALVSASSRSARSPFCLLTTLLLPLPLLAPCACLSAWSSRVCGGIIVAVLVCCAPPALVPAGLFFLLVRTYVGLWLAVMDCLLIGYVVPFFWLFFGGGSVACPACTLPRYRTLCFARV